MNKTFGVYKCDTCNREIEHEQDPIRPFLNKCNITFKCEGKLTKISEKNLRSQFKTVPAQDVIDWRPRGKTSELRKQLNLGVDEDISVLTDKSMLTIAIDSSIIPSLPNLSTTSLVANFRVMTDISTQFTEFFYRLINAPTSIVNQESVTVVQGADNSTLHKILRFSAADPAKNIAEDIIKVYVDGVEMLSPEAYTRGSNSLIFNPPLLGTKSLKIVVYKQPEQSTVSINFNYGNASGSWGNVKEIKLGSKNYTVLNCIDIGQLPANKRLLLDTIKADNTGLDLKEYVIILLSSNPWTCVDRIYQSVLVPIQMGELGVIVDSLGTDIKILKSVGILSLFPIISIIEQNKWEADKIPANTAGGAVNEQKIPLHNFILGAL